MIAGVGRLFVRTAAALAAAVLVLVAASLVADHRWRVRRARTRRPAPARSLPAGGAPQGVRPLAPQGVRPLEHSTSKGSDPLSGADSDLGRAAGASARRARPVRLAGLAVAWVAAGLAVTLLAALAGSFALGYRSMTVMSGSMEPTIHTGDVVVNRPIAPAMARVGDVITYREPGTDGRFITHRVRRVVVRGGRVAFVTKGDANTGMERWSIPSGGELGRVEYRLPHLGFVLFWTHGRLAVLVLVTIPALLLGALTLARIWRRPEEAPHGVPG